MLINFLLTLNRYVVEIAPSLILGLLISGIVHEFVPQSLINRYLNRGEFRSILYATIAGIILPLCCFGSLPIAVGFRKKGVTLGPILAFLVATPATSITAILVTLRLMGIEFTLFLCLTVIMMGLVIGYVGNHFPSKQTEPQSDTCTLCEEGEHSNHHHHGRGIKSKIISILSYGFIDMPKHIGLELIIGLLLAAAVASIAPLGNLIKSHLIGGVGYLFALVFGLVMYICSTASVPLVHSLVNQGLNIGAGLVLLLVGPITSYGTILVVRKEFGNKILLIYLTIICSFSLIFGLLFTIILK